MSFITLSPLLFLWRCLLAIVRFQFYHVGVSSTKAKHCSYGSINKQYTAARCQSDCFICWSSEPSTVNILFADCCNLSLMLCLDTVFATFVLTQSHLHVHLMISVMFSFYCCFIPCWHCESIYISSVKLQNWLTGFIIFFTVLSV